MPCELIFEIFNEVFHRMWRCDHGRQVLLILSTLTSALLLFESLAGGIGIRLPRSKARPLCLAMLLIYFGALVLIMLLSAALTYREFSS